jgi:hypothetical protein
LSEPMPSRSRSRPSEVGFSNFLLTTRAARSVRECQSVECYATPPPAPRLGGSPSIMQLAPMKFSTTFQSSTICDFCLCLSHAGGNCPPSPLEKKDGRFLIRRTPACERISRLCLGLSPKGTKIGSLPRVVRCGFVNFLSPPVSCA